MYRVTTISLETTGDDLNGPLFQEDFIELPLKSLPEEMAEFATKHPLMKMVVFMKPKLNFVLEKI